MGEAEIDDFLITIDPGKDTGWAMFFGETLAQCGLLNCRDLLIASRQIVTQWNTVQGDFVIEIPRIYPVQKWKGDPNDLVELAIIAGMIIGSLPHIGQLETVYPSTWKGQRPKDVDNKYTLSLLNPQELDKIKIKTKKRHNIIDAIGIGLWKLGRR